MPHSLGWKPDTDKRGLMYAAESEVDNLENLPSRVDLRYRMPSKPWNQEDLGSCTGQAIAEMFEYELKNQGLEVWRPSPLFIYYCEREIEGTIDEDAGAQLHNGLKAVGYTGVCPEEDWPYEIDMFAQRPTSKAYANAMIHRAVKYRRVRQNISQMRGCLAAGHPFVGGFIIFDSFDGDNRGAIDTGETGIANMPKRGEEVMGGHAILITGYDDNRRNGDFLVRNSWDIHWGEGGYFWIPYDYYTNPDLASDFWTIRLVV